MSKRKDITLLGRSTRVYALTGRFTLEWAAAVPQEQRRATWLKIVEQLRSIGIEASPKQPEMHR